MNRDLGLVGQKKISEKERQISILSSDAKEKIAQTEPQGLCMQRFFANFTISKINMQLLQPGCRLRIGTAILVVSNKGKECFESCILKQLQINCPLHDGCRFAWVEKSGAAAVGDAVIIED
jgi:hypothetical protein